MFNFSGSEIIFLLILALIILGPEKLPDAVRKFGKGYAEFKKVTTGFQEELKSALDEPMREMRETADAFKNAATFDLKLDPNAPKPAVPAQTTTPSGPPGVGAPPVPSGAEPPIVPVPAPNPMPEAATPIGPVAATAPDTAMETPAVAQPTDTPAGPATASPQGDDLGASAE